MICTEECQDDIMKTKVRNKKMVLNIQKVLTILVVLLFFITIFPFTITYVSADTWISGNWLYRKEITVSNNLDNYKTLITIGNTSGGDVNCSGYCNNDFSDIRFADEDGNFIPYWMENYTVDVQANFWVNNTYNDTTLYLYYGNESATSTSDGKQTFEIFDDFSGTTRNTSLWTDISDSPDWSNDGTLVLDNDDSVRSIVGLTGPIRVRGRSIHDQVDNDLLGIWGSSIDFYRISSTDGEGGTLANKKFRIDRKENDNLDYNYITGNSRIDSYHVYELRYSNSSAYSYQNETLLNSYFTTSHLFNTKRYCYFAVWDSTQESISTHDWIFMCPYTTGTEPSFSFGPLEGGPISYTSLSPSDGSTNVLWSQSSFTVNIAHDNGDVFDWSIETSPNVGSNSGNSASNGTKSASLSTPLDREQTYTIYVNSTDGSFEKNETYTFTTKANTPPAASSPSIANGTQTLNTTSSWSCYYIDMDSGDTVSWDIETSPDVGSNSGSGHIGTASTSLSGLANGQTYTVYVNLSDTYDISYYYFTFTVTNALLSDDVTTLETIETSFTNATVTGKVTNTTDKATVWFDYGLTASYGSESTHNQYAYNFWNDTFDVDYSSQYTTTGGWSGWTTGALKSPGNDDSNEYALFVNRSIENLTETSTWSISTYTKSCETDVVGVIAMDESGDWYAAIVDASGGDSNANGWDGIWDNSNTKLSQTSSNFESNVYHKITLEYNGTHLIMYVDDVEEATYNTSFDVHSLGVYEDENNCDVSFSWLNITYVYQETLTGLLPYTTYHYRFVSQKGGERVNGSDRTFTTEIPIIVNETTNVDENSVTLNAYRAYGDGTGTNGWWIKTTPPTPASPGTNTTEGTASSTPEEISKSILGLTAGQYYYVRAWESGFGWFRNTSDMEYFLTKPTQPSNVQTVYENSSNITLSWSKGSAAVSNLTTLIKYSTTGYPSSPTSGGTIAYNGTGTQCTIESLPFESDIYFSLWTYINESGSPTLHQFSEYPAQKLGSTSGGVNRLFIRYENISQGFVNLTHGSNHRAILHYNSRVEEIVFDSYGQIDVINSTASVSSGSNVNEGEIVFNASDQLSFVEFYWNGSENYNVNLKSKTEYFFVDDDSTNETETIAYIPEELLLVQVYNESLYGHWVDVPSSKYTLDGRSLEIDDSMFDENSTTISVVYTYYEVSPRRCKRTIIPQQGQENMTIYVLTDKLVFGESQTSSMKDALILYSYSFNGISSLENARAEIYTYNHTGSRIIIDSQYLTSSLTIQPWLLFEKSYRIGFNSEGTGYIDIGELQTSSDLSPEVNVPPQTTENGSFFMFVNLTRVWQTGGFQVTYIDNSISTTEVTFEVYYKSNRTLADTQSDVNVSNKVFTFTHTDAQTESWLFKVTATFDNSNDDYDGTYNSGYILMEYYNTTDKRADIDNIWDIIFGDSPMYDYEGTNGGAVVPWTYILLFGAALAFLLTLSKVNAFTGAVGCGMILIFGGVAILGMNLAYSWYSWWQGPSIAVVGIFVMVIGLVGLMGGVGIRRY